MRYNAWNRAPAEGIRRKFKVECIQLWGGKGICHRTRSSLDVAVDGINVTGVVVDREESLGRGGVANAQAFKVVMRMLHFSI